MKLAWRLVHADIERVVRVAVTSEQWVHVDVLNVDTHERQHVSLSHEEWMKLLEWWGVPTQ